MGHKETGSSRRRTTPARARHKTTSLPNSLKVELESGQTDGEQAAIKTKAHQSVSRKQARKAKRISKKKLSAESRLAYSSRRKRSGPIQVANDSRTKTLSQPQQPVQAQLKPTRKRVRFDEPSQRSRSKGVPPSTLQNSATNGAEEVAELDNDALEAKRLEKLLGISKKRRRKNASGKEFSVADMFEGDDDMMGLLKLCENSGKGSNNSYVRKRSNSASFPSSSERSESENDDEINSRNGSRSNGRIDANSTISVGVSSVNPVSHDPRFKGSESETSSDGSLQNDEQMECDRADPAPTVTRLANQDIEESPDPCSERNHETSGMHTDAENSHVIRAKPAREEKKYIPPTAKSSDGESTVVSRRMRGLLNRLADSNASGIAEELLHIFRSGSHGMSRRALGTLYAESILDAVRDGTIGAQINPFLAAHVAVLSHLAGTVDVSVAAEVVAVLVNRITSLFNVAQSGKGDEHQSPDREQGELRGYIALFASLYELEIIACSMTYELVRLLATNLSEVGVDLLLLLLRTVGPTIRAQDPVSLKDIILFIKDSAATTNRDADSDAHCANVENLFSSRVDVMLDLIYELKENKLKKTRMDGPSARFPWMATSGVSLSASFADLMDVEFTNERWWELEAGRARVKETSASARRERAVSRPVRVAGEIHVDDVDLVYLAASQRLNTEFRRSVFGVIMGSSGVGDAYERLEFLGALEKKDGKDKDAVRVLIHCCGTEKCYNKFYGELASRICDRGRSLRFAFEFALWESISTLLTAREGLSRRRKAWNYGRLLGSLMASTSLRLYALRNAPEFDNCTGDLLVLYRTAFGALFGDESSLDAGKTAVQALVHESGADADAFRGSVSLFLMREIHPLCREPARSVVLECVRALKK
jgi:nucleolar MIF4G domain-containing protein 1